MAGLDRDVEGLGGGAHPFGTVGGAVLGAMAGATLGSLVGALGVWVGAPVGGVLGGIVGDALAEVMNPTPLEGNSEASDDNNQNSGGVAQLREDVQSTVTFGMRARLRQAREGPAWEDVEPELEAEWPTSPFFRGEPWDAVRETVEAAYRVTDQALQRHGEGRIDERVLGQT
jgi:hypothetical protein